MNYFLRLPCKQEKESILTENASVHALAPFSSPLGKRFARDEGRLRGRGKGKTDGALNPGPRLRGHPL